jgi:ribose transport system permease protein
MKRLLAQREFAILIAIAIMIALFTLVNPIYISASNLIDIVDQSTINGLLAIGITFAILTGGIDLSIGSTFAIVIVFVGKVLAAGSAPPVAVALGVMMGFLLGAINGLLVTKMRLQPFIATLGMMSVYRGVAYIFTGGWPVLNMPSSFRKMLDGDLIGEIPVSAIILFAVAFMGYVFLRHTRFGTYLYAIGGNEEATRLSGVPVDRGKIIAYAICGLAAGLSGMVLLARLGTGEPTAGQGYELNAIAAAAIGGTSLSGGKGSMLGTLLGAILLSALKVGLIVAGVDTFWQYIATGLIIVVAAYFEVIQSKLETVFSAKRRS